MRIVVIGGTGRIGTYLIPRLVESGHEVVVVSRQQRKPFQPTKDWGKKAWKEVAMVELDRTLEEAAGNFGDRITELLPDAVFDINCYREESATQLVNSLCGRVQLFVHCGTIWSSGPTLNGPGKESDPGQPIGDYGRRKAAVETFLLEEAQRTGFPAVVLRPGHLVGSGWAPVNPAANLNLQVYRDLANGHEVCLPNKGLETLHHVHADDVAQAFMCVLEKRDRAAGESFNVTSPAALTLKDYTEAVAGWFGTSARLRFLPWEQWRQTVLQEDAALSMDHLLHSSNCSIAKAQQILGYRPRYTSLEAVKESLMWLIAARRIAI
jgi:nucleoside-diphosphate-sugar epimerase